MAHRCRRSSLQGSYCWRIESTGPHIAPFDQPDSIPTVPIFLSAGISRSDLSFGQSHLIEGRKFWDAYATLYSILQHSRPACRAVHLNKAPCTLCTVWEAGCKTNVAILNAHIITHMEVKVQLIAASFALLAFMRAGLTLASAVFLSLLAGLLFLLSL